MVNVRVERDICYGVVSGYRPLELDLYRPEPDRQRPSSSMFMVVAGAVGQDASPCPRSERISTLSWRLKVSQWRRLTTGQRRGTLPGAFEDVCTAVSWVQTNAAAYAMDPQRIFLWGGSGGHQPALLAALSGTTVRGVVTWFPVTDFIGLPSDVAEAGGVPDSGPDSREALFLGAPAAAVPELARQASPVCHASGAAPPILLMHGASDDMVPPAQSVRLAKALGDAGASVELELVPGATHFWKGAADVPAIVQRSLRFLACLA